MKAIIDVAKELANRVGWVIGEVAVGQRGVPGYFGRDLGGVDVLAGHAGSVLPRRTNRDDGGGFLMFPFRGPQDG